MTNKDHYCTIKTTIKYHQATCTCGYKGAERSLWISAERDFKNHLNYISKKAIVEALHNDTPR